MAGRRADEDPLYKTLTDEIRRRIRSGEFAVGARIPTEHELCAGEGVSRTTVRQAVQALVNEGVLDRQQGRGTFVTSVPAKRDVLFEHLTQPALTFAFIESGWAPPSFEMATAFGAPLDQDIFTMTRLRLDKDRPIAVTRYFTFVEALRTQPLTEQERTSALFDSMLAMRGVRSVRSNIIAELIVIDGEDADHLEVDRGSVSVATRRVGFNDHGRAVRLSQTIVRPDRARLYWSLQHKHGVVGEGAGATLTVWNAAGTD